MTAAPRPGDVVGFWRDAGPERWYAKDERFDAEIGRRFGALHAEASAGGLADWATTPEGTLALILILDQFSRNLHRGTAAAFANDASALSLARIAIGRGFDEAVEPQLRQFVYLPFMHSEALHDQDLSVALFTALMDGANLKYALEHRDIIRRFGRYPHRNAVLGRATMPDEQAFLDAGGFAG